MVSQAELKKRRVRAAKQSIRQEVVVDRRERRRKLWITVFMLLLTFALIAPLAAGLFGTDSAEAPGDQASPPEVTLTTEPPTLVEPEFAGASLQGDTPCPVTDGSQQRVTSFETAPEGCIDPSAGYSVALDTEAGKIDIALDHAAAPVASDLFVSLARFGVYQGAPLTFGAGVAVAGGFGDAGFVIAATEPPSDGQYPVGSVVMFTDIAGDLNGQIAIVVDESGSEALANDPTQPPIVGTVTAGLDSIGELAELQAANSATTYRLLEATVTQTDG